MTTSLLFGTIKVTIEEHFPDLFPILLDNAPITYTRSGSLLYLSSTQSMNDWVVAMYEGTPEDNDDNFVGAIIDAPMFIVFVRHRDGNLHFPLSIESIPAIIQAIKDDHELSIISNS